MGLQWSLWPMTIPYIKLSQDLDPVEGIRPQPSPISYRPAFERVSTAWKACAAFLVDCMFGEP